MADRQVTRCRFTLDMPYPSRVKAGDTAKVIMTLPGGVWIVQDDATHEQHQVKANAIEIIGEEAP